jgi:glucosamine--fructose-6-phosphate aminotransferase (isomerizing)
MCGIVGYVGGKSASDVVLAGLKTLEYRGYDSAGIALLDDGEKPHLYKQIGRVDALEKEIDKSNDSAEAHIGIGHTRWATHGAPSIANAHPHSNADGSIYVVHNGIIENYADLRESLEQEGYRFVSETDTEVIPHLIDFYTRSAKTFADAFEKALLDLRGAYAVLAMTTSQPNTLFAARLSSPLVIGVGKKEFVVASDPSAILAHTKEVIYLQDNEMIQISPTGHDIKDIKKAEKVVHESNA